MAEFIFSFFVGFVANLIITSITRIPHNKIDGVLQIDRHNPEKDIYRLEIGRIDKLSSKKYIRLKVNNDADLSQE